MTPVRIWRLAVRRTGIFTNEFINSKKLKMMKALMITKSYFGALLLPHCSGWGMIFGQPFPSFRKQMANCSSFSPCPPLPASPWWLPRS